MAPFLKKSFPSLHSFTILLDGEKLLRGAPAKAALKKANISVMPGWPQYSPDLNPQENVWAWAEPRLRQLESGSDTFQTFQKNALKAVGQYPAASKLVASMARRCKTVLDLSGGMLDD